MASDSKVRGKMSHSYFTILSNEDRNFTVKSDIIDIDSWFSGMKFEYVLKWSRNYDNGNYIKGLLLIAFHPVI